MNETEKQFSLSRVAFSTCGRAKTKFLSVYQFLGAEDDEELRSLLNGFLDARPQRFASRKLP